MNIFDAYSTDLNAEEKGRWFENGDVEFLIARSGNRAYNDMIQTQFTAHKHTLDQKDTPEARAAGQARAEQIQTMVMSRTVLLGWRGLPKKDAEGKVIEVDGAPVLGQLIGRKGEALTYSVAAAAAVLALKDFRAWVNGKSDDFRNYLEAVKVEDEKNSEATSAGSSPGAVA